MCGTHPVPGGVLHLNSVPVPGDGRTWVGQHPALEQQTLAIVLLFDAGLLGECRRDAVDLAVCGTSGHVKSPHRLPAGACRQASSPLLRTSGKNGSEVTQVNSFEQSKQQCIEISTFKQIIFVLLTIAAPLSGSNNSL